MPYIPASIRRQVIERAGGFCEYCLADQLNGVPMEIDHIAPTSAGGKTEPDNLCLACRYCNAKKLRFETGIDPQTGQPEPLYHPRKQRWQDHFAWSEDGTEILGTTPTGRATIARLDMNRALIVATRQRWVKAGLHPPAAPDESS